MKELFIKYFRDASSYQSIDPTCFNLTEYTETWLINHKKQLTIHSVSVSFSKDDMKKCADFWNGKHIEQKYFDQYLNER